MLERVERFAQLLEGEADAPAFTAIRAAELTGRPLGAADFVTDLERLLGRPSPAELPGAGRSCRRWRSRAYHGREPRRLGLSSLLHGVRWAQRPSVPRVKWSRGRVGLPLSAIPFVCLNVTEGMLVAPTLDHTAGHGGQIDRRGGAVDLSPHQAFLVDAESTGDPFQHVQGDIAPTVLDAGQVGHMDPRFMRERVLRKSLRFAQGLHISSHDFPQIHRGNGRGPSCRRNRL